MTPQEFSFDGFTPDQQKALRAIRRDYLRIILDEVALLFKELDRLEDDATNRRMAPTYLLVDKGAITTEELEAAFEQTHARLETQRSLIRERDVSEFEQRMLELRRKLQAEDDSDGL